jgi:hypothetical protein
MNISENSKNKYVRQWFTNCSTPRHSCYLELCRKTVKLMTQGGNMLELCHELRSPFVLSMSANQALFSNYMQFSFFHLEKASKNQSYPLKCFQCCYVDYFFQTI